MTDARPPSGTQGADERQQAQGAVPVPGMKWRLAGRSALLFTLSACGGGGVSAPEALPPSAASNPSAADVTVLMLGNSHTSANALPQQLQALLRAGMPGKSVEVVVAPDWLFLDEHLGHAPTMTLLRSRSWSAIVFQAQKYSTTGTVTYSTAEAQALVAEARKLKAMPVLFPEWPRLGEPETQRIYDLHVSIARAQPACVAPIGQAWDLSQARWPSLVLHARDGNHSAPPGAHLTALMLYATLTGRSALDLAEVPGDFGVSPAEQAQLRQVAADTAQRIAPRLHCPDDKALGER